MIYYTMRFRNERNKLYYVYVNDDFDRIESLPQLLYEYPDETVSAIDGDITKVGDKYHLFYVAHDGQPVSSRLFPTVSAETTNTIRVGTILNRNLARLPRYGNASERTNGC